MTFKAWQTKTLQNQLQLKKRSLKRMPRAETSQSSPIFKQDAARSSRPCKEFERWRIGRVKRGVGISLCHPCMVKIHYETAMRKCFWKFKIDFFIYKKISLDTFQIPVIVRFSWGPISLGIICLLRLRQIILSPFWRITGDMALLSGEKANI